MHFNARFDLNCWQTDGQTDGRKFELLYRTLLEAGATIVYFKLRLNVLACCVYVLQINVPFSIATLGASEHSRKC